MAETKKALNVPDTYTWEECNDIDYTSLPKGSIWMYDELKAAGIKMAHYSGDTDGVVPHVGTFKWMHAQGWEIVEPYREWVLGPFYLGGWVERREGLDLIIIHGAGHMVPQWKREVTTTAFGAWVAGEEMPKPVTPPVPPPI